MIQEIKRKKKSLREVLPRTQVKQIYAEPAPADSGATNLPPPPRAGGTRSRPVPRYQFRWGRFFLIIIVICVLGFFVSQLFATARVEVSPLQAKVKLDESIEATREPGANTVGLTFDTVTIGPETETRSVASTTKATLNTKATGKIVIYNDYSSAPQKLVAQTRFQAASGKIYRLTQAVTVPGTKKDGAKTIPGQLETTVTADVAGASYNASLTDFTIPGFKGDTRFTKIYARSKTPMTGGYSGEKLVVPAELEQQTRAEMQKTLQEKLLASARFQVPEDFILYQDASFVETQSDQTADAASPNTAVLRETGTLKGIIFKRADLAGLLLGDVKAQFKGANVTLDNLDDLTVTLANRSTIDPDATKKISFKLSGEGVATAVLDTAALKERLAGSQRGDLQALFQEFPAISGARVIFTPPWALRVPPADKVVVEIVKN